MQLSKKSNLPKIYNIDITLTHNCSFKCDYCFARSEKTANFENNKQIFDFIDNVRRSAFFKNNFRLLNIGLWGGEPLLNVKLCESLLKYYRFFDEVKFFIYSNGYNIPESIYKELLSAKRKRLFIHPKICIQISYDGIPIHDIYRRTNNGKITSDIIKEQIKRLDADHIPFVIKSTVTPETFKYMAMAYKDIKQLSSTLSGLNFQPMNYFPTIDYYTSEHKGQYKDDLQKSLIQIAKSELKSSSWKQKQYFFAWFNENRALCSAGKDLIAIDIDGNIYTCHGCMYDSYKKEHYFGNITETNIIDKLQSKYFLFTKNLLFEPEECKKCEVSYCLRCNHAKFINSKKSGYFEKWRDYANQPELCEYYKINHKVKLAMKYLEEK